MGFPAGMQLATVAFGIPLTVTGKEVVTHVTVKPTSRVIWAATGQPLPEFSDSFTAEAGQLGQFQVPFIDQGGFIDSTGAAVTDWAYQVTASWSFGNERPITWAKNLKPLLGQTGPIDLDLVPDGPVSLPVTAPTAAVLGFNGRTGFITLTEADLPERLSDAALNATYGPQSGAAHLIIGGGQSNNTQSDTTLPVAVADDRLYKWDGANIVPLPATETYLLPAFARQYANTIPKGDWVVIVPCAVGSTGFTSTSISPAPSGYHYYPSPGTWDRALTADTNNFYAQMVSKTLAAKAAADAITAKPVTIDALLWSQGEEDTPFLNEAQYAAKLDDLIATFRTDVGDSLLPVIVGSMVPEYGYARGQVNTANVAAALSNTPARTFATAFAWGPEGLPKNGEVIHYSTQAQIKRGPLFLDGLYRARVNRAATKPVAPVGLSLVREASGQVTLRWEPPYARVTGYDIDFTFDGGTVWIPGVLDKDSRLKATSAALPWETVRARIRTKADGAVLLSDYAYSATLGAYEKATVGSALYFVGGENITAHTGAMTLYSVFTLPASGGEATINARSNDSTRQFYMTARQSDATDSVTAVTGGGTLFGNFPGNKATAGAHVNAAALAADGGALTTKRGTDAAATVTGTPGNVLAETLRVTSTGGTVVHGAYLFRGHAHDSATMASIQETLRVRHGLTRLGPL